MGTFVANRIKRAYPRTSDASESSEDMNFKDCLGSDVGCPISVEELTRKVRESDNYVSKFLPCEWEEQYFIKSSKRSRSTSSEILAEQFNHQKRILEALTPSMSIAELGRFDNIKSCKLHKSSLSIQRHGALHNKNQSIRAHKPSGQAKSASLQLQDGLLSTTCGAPSYSIAMKTERISLRPSTDAVQHPQPREQDICPTSRYSSIADMLEAMGGASESASRDGHSCAAADDDSLALLLKYTHVGGGA